MKSCDSEPDPVNQLAEGFLERYRRGERPSLSEYTRQYPDLADEIREVFPALVAIEELGQDAKGSPAADGTRPSGKVEIPLQLGEYRILREVGRGGMGIVYEAVQETLGRHVALKVLPFHGLLNPVHLERFRREARAAARLHHTNIVPVFGVGEHEGIHYYAMQFILGQGLDEVLREVRRMRGEKSLPAGREGSGSHSSSSIAASVAESLFTGRFSGSEYKEQAIDRNSRKTDSRTDPVPPSGPVAGDARTAAAQVHSAPSNLSSEPGARYFGSVAQIALQAAEALQYAHEQGVLHRDVKPSNLLLDTAGRVWITDFGLAKADDSDELTSPGEIVGTLCYMAPERFQGKADARSDVYGLGITLYEMLTLQPAFQDSNRARLIERAAREEPRRPCRIDPYIPRDLETIVLKAIGKEPAERYPTAAALAEELRRFLADRPILSRRSSARERTWRWCRRNPAVAITSALAAGALVAALVLSLALAIHQHNAADRLRAALGQAQTQWEEAQKQRHLAERLSTTYAMQQGLNLCEQEDVPLGLLWLAQSLRIAPEHALDLQRAARANLASWKAQCPPLKALLQHDDAVFSIVFSHDGKRILTGGWDGYARIWSADGVRLGHFALGCDVGSVDLSPDGQVAFAAGSLGGQLWDIASGKALGPRFSRDVNAAVINPADGTVITVDSQGNVKRWEGRTGEARGDVCSIRAYPRALAVSPDGRNIATGDDKATARLWDARTGEPRGAPLPHSAEVFCVAFDPSGARLLTGTKDGIAQVWDTAAGSLLGRPLQHRDEIRAVSFSHDGQEILTASTDGTAQRWDAATFRRLGTPLRCRGQVYAAVFSPDGRTVATGGTENVARLWDISGPITAEYEPPRSPEPQRRGVVVSPFRHNHSVRAVAVSRDGRYVLTGSDDRWAQLWELKTGARIGRPLVHPEKGRVRAVAISPDGKLLLTGSFDNCARLWDAATGNPVGQPVRHDALVWAVAFSPDGTRFISGDARGQVRCWDVATRKPVSVSFKHPGAKINALAYSPDGRMIVSAGHEDKKARRWDAYTGLPLPGPPLQHGEAVWAVDFSPDGKTLATGSWDGTARLWDSATGKALEPTFPHQAKVEAVALSPDGKTLVTGGLDGLARLWDVATRKPIGPPMKHENIVLSVAFHPDGRRIITGCADKAAHVWSVQPPLAGSADEIMESIELLTGLRLEPGGAAVSVDAKDWSKRYSDRHRLPLNFQLPLSRWYAGLNSRRGGVYADKDEPRKGTDSTTAVLEQLTAAIARNPEDAELYRKRSQAYERLNKFDQAVADLGEAIKRRPDDAGLYAARGVNHKWLEQWDKAIADYEKALALEKNQAKRAMLYNHLAWAYLMGAQEVRDPERAIKLCRQAIALEPRVRGQHTVLGIAYYRLGQYVQAAETLEQNIEINHGPVWGDGFFLAMSYHKLGLTVRAKECFKQARQWQETNHWPPAPGEELRRMRSEAEAVLSKSAK